MNKSINFSLPACIGLVCLANTSQATIVVVRMQASGGAPSQNMFVSTNIPNGSARASGSAPAANMFVSGSMSPEISGPAHTSLSDESSSVRQSSQPRFEERGGHTSDSSRSRGASRVRVESTPRALSSDAKGSKSAITPEIVYNDPGAFQFTAEAGYASKHIWRGIDLAKFTSTNHLLRGTADKNGNIISDADSDVTFINANATYQGFSLGLKYIETIDDTFNPFFAAADTDIDSYQELILSMNYTRMLVGNDLLQGTVGFDFYYYPNGEFWGVDHQGMIYARFSSPHYKWAQPFLEVFYNVATDTTGNGLANTVGFPPPKNFSSFRGATGSDLVEGGGCEIGINGGDRVFSNGFVSLGLTYSVSTFYKTGYAFEDDGFSHVSLTLGAPLLIGSNLTITPSVSYVAALGDIQNNPGAKLDTGGSAAEAWNEPGWVASIKASWHF